MKKLLYYLVALSTSLFWNGCKDTPTETTIQDIPNKASDFLYDLPNGTILTFKSTSLIKDTNGVETPEGGATIPLTVVKTKSQHADGSWYAVYSTPTIDKNRSLIANDSSLWLAPPEDLSKHYSRMLRLPCVNGKSFDNEDSISNTGASLPTIIDANTLLDVEYGKLRVVGVQKTSSSGTTEQVVRTEANWFSKGLGIVKTQSITTTTYPSNKTSVQTFTKELVSVTKQ